MTSSGQSHQLRTGTVLKPDLTSRVFLRLVILVITVRCVNSEILRGGLGARIYENASENIMKMMFLESTFLQVYKKR